MPSWLTLLDVVADLAAICAALAVIATARFVWRQTRLQADSRDKDTRRFLRESIFVVHDTLQGEQFRNARVNFFGADRHALDFARMDDADKGRARYILSVYSLLWNMIDQDAIDEGVARRYWQVSLIRDWDRLENFVSGERMRTANGHLFDSTEQLVARWKSKTDQTAAAA